MTGRWAKAPAGLVAVGLDPHDKLSASRKAGPSGADAFDDQDGSWRHLNRPGLPWTTQPGGRK